ncbi:archaellin/type IV pilin N-terminal domain-containing protein [Methanocalculus chunghsingensis]|nr:archaellin/type IV pilin N-terminal domain-containing protein [Methanocalculus chunghsingensis]
MNERAFTGLEAAIVLIAFIVVAAVFSYVMLGAGFFTTQKSQETVYSAIGQAATNMEVSGPIILMTDNSGTITNATFTLILAAGGSPVDMNKVTYTVMTRQGIFELADSASDVTRSWYNAGDENNLLERGEILTVKIEGASHIGTINANEPFSIEVKPSTGAALPIARTAPLSLTKNSVYQVY